MSVRQPGSPSPPPPPPRPRAPAAPSAATQELPAPVRSLFSGIAIFKALFAALASIVFAILGPFVLQQVASAASQQNVTLDASTAFFAARPYLVSLACIPTFAASILAIVDRKRRWMWLTVTTLLLLAMLAVLILALLKLLSPLYNPQL